VMTQTMVGDWDSALATSAALRDAGDESARQADLQLPLILAARGQVAEIEAWLAQPLVPSEWQELEVGEQIGRAVALAYSGRAEEGGELMASVAPTFVRTDDALLALFLGDVVDILQSTGHASLAEEILAPLDFTTPTVAGQVARGRGLLQLRRGEPAEAEATLRDAVRTLRAVDHPFALARALFSHADCLDELGRSGEAEPLRYEARSVFEDLGAAAWLERPGVPSATA
jgi:hypothetical protein